MEKVDRDKGNKEKGTGLDLEGGSVHIWLADPMLGESWNLHKLQTNRDHGQVLNFIIFHEITKAACWNMVLENRFDEREA